MCEWNPVSMMYEGCYGQSISSESIRSSSSLATDFNWELASAGFVDAFPVFVLIFGIWGIVRLFRMVL